MVSSATADADLTSRARIRNAAITRFAAQSVEATSLREIADDVGVSQALIIHHFGSKAALRVACDQHIATLIREQKQAAMREGAALDPLAAVRRASREPPVVRYLARTLPDRSPEVVALVDELVRDAESYMAEGVRSGALKPTDYPRERAVVLTMWSLGAITMHEHMERLLGVDLTGDPEQQAPYFLAAGELMARGVLADAAYERLREAFQTKGDPR